MMETEAPRRFVFAVMAGELKNSYVVELSVIAHDGIAAWKALFAEESVLPRPAVWGAVLLRTEQP